MWLRLYVLNQIRASNLTVTSTVRSTAKINFRELRIIDRPALCMAVILLLYMYVFVLFEMASSIESVSIYPQADYNVPLDPDLPVQFNCTVASPSANIEWRVNNTIPSLGSELTVSRGVIASGVEMIGPEMFLSSLSIPARSDNNNTTVMCRVIDSDRGRYNDSNVILLRIQGLLDAPPNLLLSGADDGLSRVLSWDAPETLDITNIDPDIQSYRVCYNLTNEMTCVSVSSTKKREFKFLNVRVPLLFNVTAINVVGEGAASSIVHQPIGCDNRGRPIAMFV